METLSLLSQIPIYKYKIPTHSEEKLKILSDISLMGKHPIIEKQQIIDNTDWQIGRETERPYFKKVESMITPCLKSISDKYDLEGKPDLHIVNHWFQQYSKGDFHGWHVHGGCLFSSIYYVELPINAETTFKVNGKEETVEVYEGDYIVFS